MSGSNTFLPEEYVQTKKRAVTNVICLALFAVVMFGTFVAFLVTTRRASAIEAQKAQIDAEYASAAADIEELRRLEQQKDLMMERAELAAALVERVPRSILLAELINRMPKKVSLIEFTLESEKLRQIERAPKPAGQTGKTGRLAPARQKTVGEAVAEGKRAKVTAPKYKVSLALTGVAPTDREVGQFIGVLNTYALVREARLDYSNETTIGDVVLREFRIELVLESDADIRDIDPLTKEREVRDPIRQDSALPAGFGG